MPLALCLLRKHHDKANDKQKRSSAELKSILAAALGADHCSEIPRWGDVLALVRRDGGRTGGAPYDDHHSQEVYA